MRQTENEKYNDKKRKIGRNIRSEKLFKEGKEERKEK